MTKEKQIEEMAKILAKSDDCGDCTNCIHSSWCPDNSDATALYNAGYRKADEVAREIFEEIEALLYQNAIMEIATSTLHCRLAELKKKYTEDK